MRKYAKYAMLPSQKKYYENKVQPLKVYTMKYTYEKLITDNNGNEITLLLTNDKKICRFCDIEKNYDNYSYVATKYKNKKCLAAECKECVIKIKLNKKLLIKILENTTINNNIFE